jgi:uncharacterized protein with ATP-grasp and redox domains
MTIDVDCVGCIINQSVRVADAIDASSPLRDKLVSTVEDMSQSFSTSQTPPQIAAYVYEKMATIANKDDLYDEVKKASTKKALSFIPILKEKLLNSNDKLLTATKIAVAGNVIDLAAAVTFDLEQELDKIFHTDFAHNDVLDKFILRNFVPIPVKNRDPHINVHGIVFPENFAQGRERNSIINFQPCLS